jgi:hypothetical protein
MKTFWTGIGGWADQQLPDGTIIWTTPSGATYTTHPGSSTCTHNYANPPPRCRPANHHRSSNPPQTAPS